ncbi:Bgt-50971, partial [Blumeria graminis f. sp. tritici]
VYETKDHLDNLDLSRATYWQLNASNRFVPKGSHVNTITKPSMERNRLLTRMAVTPRGRPIYSSGSILDFVAGIQDAIKGHEGLVGKGILHGDVCEEKIVLLKTTSDKDMHGMLTGLEHSVKIKDNLAKDYEHILTGNLKFMALERLKNFSLTGEVIRRTCRHDLESFFYVFIVGCIEYGKVSESKDNSLNDWCRKDLKMNFMCKAYYVMSSEMLEKFTPSFEGLKGLGIIL